MNTVHVWTDGGQDGSNPGPGAWASILTFNGFARVACGFVPFATNNALETLAVVGALRCLHSPCKVMLYSDSQYVFNGIRKVSQTKGAKTLKTNVECWQQYIAAAMGHIVVFNKVDGHAFDHFNNMADALAAYCAKNKLNVNFTTSVERIDASRYKSVEHFGPDILREVDR